MQIESKLVGTFSVKSSAITQAHLAVRELRLSTCQYTRAITHSWWRDGITNEVLVVRFHFTSSGKFSIHRANLFADVTCYRRWAPPKHLMFPYSLLIYLVFILYLLLIWRTRLVLLGRTLYRPVYNRIWKNWNSGIGLIRSCSIGKIYIPSFKALVTQWSGQSRCSVADFCDSCWSSCSFFMHSLSLSMAWIVDSDIFGWHSIHSL